MRFTNQQLAAARPFIPGELRAVHSESLDDLALEECSRTFSVGRWVLASPLDGSYRWVAGKLEVTGPALTKYEVLTLRTFGVCVEVVAGGFDPGARVGPDVGKAIAAGHLLVVPSEGFGFTEVPGTDGAAPLVWLRVASRWPA